jgi:alanine-glyoxylate transaminase/serine-glyoxylate transaminase/serine-pyruvate transaminase
MPGELNPSLRLLLGPGPSEPHPRVLRAQAVNLLGHLDPEFLQIMTDTQDMLRQVFRTKNEFTFPVSGTGMAGMECVVANLLEPGDPMVVCAAGFFGKRMADLARRAGGNVTVVQGEWGDAISLEKIEAALTQHRPKVLGIVHGETSTGVLQPIDQLGKLCHRHGVLLAVDTVTSLATAPVEVDAWELDAVYSGSQKGLGCPPGLAPVTFSARAVDAIKARQRPVQSYYLDAVELMKYWGKERFYHHTAPISSVYALREGLRVVLEEGLEARWARHVKHWRALKAGLTALGLPYLAKEPYQLPALSAVRIPDGVDDLTIRKRLATEFGIEIGGGLGAFKGKLWRIGLMGHGSRAGNVLTLLAALEKCLVDLGWRIKLSPLELAAKEVS